MRRLAALLSCALAALAASAAPTHAVQSLAYTFVVDCANPGGTNSLVGLPNGTYAVTVAGACTVNGPYSTPVGGTPCVGALPCLSPITVVNNVPGPTCTVATGGVEAAGLCGPRAALTGCANLYVAVDGACLGGQAGLRYRAPGAGGTPMNVRFVDSNYADNAGVLLVTVAWTPL